LLETIRLVERRGAHRVFSDAAPPSWWQCPFLQRRLFVLWTALPPLFLTSEARPAHLDFSQVMDYAGAVMTDDATGSVPIHVCTTQMYPRLCELPGGFDFKHVRRCVL
jgi:hypothetical protein